MPTQRDYYEILGIPRDASPEDLKRAYRKLAMQFHPDRNKEPGAEERFKEVSEAYAVLADAEKRAVYDRLGHAGFDQRYTQEDIFRGADFGEFGMDLNDVFRTFFGGAFGGGGQRRGRDLRADLRLTLEEAASGVERELRVERHEACGACRGTGAKAGTALSRCSDCGGAGQVRRVARTVFGNMVNVGPCPTCNGRGSVIKTPCPACRGHGQVVAQRTLAVHVPPGVATGMNLRLRGEGAGGDRGQPAGDLFVTLEVEEHAVFRRDGDDLHVAVPLTFSQAALGDEVEVPRIDGKRERLKVPAGTQSGEVFRLRGKGMPSVGTPDRGDLVVHARVYTPAKLSDREREIFEELRKMEGTDRPKSFFDKFREKLG